MNLVKCLDIPMMHCHLVSVKLVKPTTTGRKMPLKVRFKCEPVFAKVRKTCVTSCDSSQPNNEERMSCRLLYGTRLHRYFDGDVNIRTLLSCKPLGGTYCADQLCI